MIKTHVRIEMIRSIAIVGIALAAVSLAACEPAKPPAVVPQKEDYYTARIKAAAAAQLRDPSSAQFRNVTPSLFGYPQICGEINGKNAYGAYAGYQAFSGGIDEEKEPFALISKDFHDRASADRCKSLLARQVKDQASGRMSRSHTLEFLEACEGFDPSFWSLDPSICPGHSPAVAAAVAARNAAIGDAAAAAARTGN